MLLLAIETSCDETAAAVVRDGREVLSSIVSSQIDLHARFGGVVPELASRRHAENIAPVVATALQDAGVTLAELEGIVATRGPGLVGALLVGLSFAKALAYARRLPWVGVHHIEGHLHAVRLEQELAFPCLGLAVSGGHTHLYRIDGVGRYQILGQTLDDASGEAFDKVAKLLGLGYPGGAVIDRLAAGGNPRAFAFPRALLKSDDLDFSFSGVKTAVLNHLRLQGPPAASEALADLAASFQEAVVEVLVEKTRRAVERTGIPRVVVSGGVACNQGLRRRFAEVAAAAGFSVQFPSPRYCSDNAAMLAVPGDAYLSAGCRSPLELNALPSWLLDEAGRSLLQGV